MFEIVSNSLEETENIGINFSKTLKGNEVVALFGGLGAGKTSFVGGIAKGLSLSDEISSPTFSLVNEYTSGKFPVYHFDMYRVTNWENLYSTGFFDYLNSGVLIIEWSENISEFLPDDAVKIFIDRCLEDEKRIFKFPYRIQ